MLFDTKSDITAQPRVHIILRKAAYGDHFTKRGCDVARWCKPKLKVSRICRWAIHHRLLKFCALMASSKKIAKTDAR